MNPDIDRLTQSISDNPTDAWLYWERGRLYLRERRSPLALDDFTRAIELDPGEPAFWRERGFVHQVHGNITESQADLNRAVELHPDDPESYDDRGWCYKRNREFDAALADFDRAIELDPLEPVYHSHRGLLRLAMDDLSRALKDFDEAIRLDPEEPVYFFERADALLYSNPEVDPEVALPDLEEAIRLRPDADWYRTERGYIRFWQGRWAEAAEDFACLDFRRVYSYWPEGGIEWLIWLDLARRFEGRPSLGQDAAREYLDWYLNHSRRAGRPDQTREQRLKAWPVPLARFIAGEIDERQLLADKNLDADGPDHDPWDRDEALERIRECRFVLAARSRAQGLADQAEKHLRLAVGLESRKPMNWVVARWLGDASPAPRDPDRRS